MRSKITYCIIILVFALVKSNITLANTNVILPYENIYWKNLLHYGNDKSRIPKNSSFFTSKDGYKNSKSEYKQILYLLKQDNSDIQCVFPARSNFIALQENLENINFNSCTDLLEYEQSVPIDYVEMAFACEDNSNPSSMLGHSFLILTGVSEGIERKHVIEYATSIRNIGFFQLISKGILGTLKGIYALYPYEEYKNKYLSEGRSIWKFRLSLTQKEIEKLKYSIWELKNKESYYSILRHNCNSALMDLLKISNTSFEYENNKPFITPIEYLQFLKKENKIEKTSIDLTKSAFKDIEKNGLNDILYTPKPSKINLSYLYDRMGAGLNLGIMPLYQDIFDIISTSNEMRDSKILNINTTYYFKNKYVIDNIEIIKTRSFPDFLSNNKFSKHFKIAIDSIPNRYNNLFPDLELGFGIARNTKNIKIYLLPYIGYRYKIKNTFYFIPEVGISIENDKNKLLFNYSQEFNLLNKDMNLSKLTGYFGYKLTRDYLLFIESNYYPKLDYSYNFSVGIRKYF